MHLSITFWSLFASNFVTNFKQELDREIGLKSLGPSGDSTLGIKVIKEPLILSRLIFNLPYQISMSSNLNWGKPTLETCNRAADDTSKPVDRIESCIFFIKNVALVGYSNQVSIFGTKEIVPSSDWQQLQPNIENTAKTSSKMVKTLQKYCY